MSVVRRLGLALIALVTFFAAGAGAQTITITLPEYITGGTFVQGLTFPRPSVTVGTFHFVIPPGQQIVSATINGTFGNSFTDSSAGVDVYLDGLLVAQCRQFTRCWHGHPPSPLPTPWSFTFDRSQFSLFADGTAVLTAVQTSPFFVQLGQTTLTLTLTNTSSLIDILPGRFPNRIDLNSRGTVAVAILSSAGFDAPGQVDKSSLRFGRTGDELSLAFCGPRGPDDADAAENPDVNNDGRPDLVCYFYIQLTGFQPGDTQGTLKGKTLGGTSFMGSDSILTLPPSR